MSKGREDLWHDQQFWDRSDSDVGVEGDEVRDGFTSTLAEPLLHFTLQQRKCSLPAWTFLMIIAEHSLWFHCNWTPVTPVSGNIVEQFGQGLCIIEHRWWFHCTVSPWAGGWAFEHFKQELSIISRGFIAQYHPELDGFGRGLGKDHDRPQLMVVSLYFTGDPDYCKMQAKELKGWIFKTKLLETSGREPYATLWQVTSHIF